MEETYICEESEEESIADEDNANDFSAALRSPYNFLCSESGPPSFTSVFVRSSELFRRQLMVYLQIVGQCPFPNTLKRERKMYFKTHIFILDFK